MHNKHSWFRDYEDVNSPTFNRLGDEPESVVQAIREFNRSSVRSTPGTETRRRPRRSFLSYFARSEDAPGDVAGPEPKAKTSVDGAAVRKWLLAVLPEQSSAEQTPGEDRLVTLEGSEGKVSLTLPIGSRIARLLIRDVSIEGMLRLENLIAPTVRVEIDDVDVDRIVLVDSHFHSLDMTNLGTSDFPGVCVFADRLQLEQDFRIIGGENKFIPDELPKGQPYPFKRKDLFARIDLLDCKARSVQFWQITVNGPHFLAHMRNSGEVHNPALYRFLARGINLIRANLQFALFYEVNSFGPISLRFASISSQTKFEDCRLVGIVLRRPGIDNEENAVLDQYDSDDFRALDGRILDLSRASLGRELVFRTMNDSSSGWINMSHASVEVLSDDHRLWHKQPKRRWFWQTRSCPVRFRLYGFRYGSLAALSLARSGLTLEDSLKTPETDASLKKRLWGYDTPRSGKPAKVSGVGRGASLDQSAEKEPSVGEISPERMVLWLKCQMKEDLGHEFKSQPWTQCARAFSQQGSRSDADELFFERERLWHASLRKKAVFQLSRSWPKSARFLFYWFSYGILNWLPGYGYKNWRTLFLAGVIWVLGACVFASAYEAGLLMQNPDATNKIASDRKFSGPQDARVENFSQSRGGMEPIWLQSATRELGNRVCTSGLLSDCVVTLAEADASSTRSGEKADTVVADSYARFYPIMYSLDLLIPVVEFSQSNYWIPGIEPNADGSVSLPTQTKKSTLYWLDWLWIWYWFQIFMGWYLVTILASSIAGLLERDE